MGTPTDESAKIAVRIQQILAHELGIANTVDPLGGAYFIETLTSQIEKQILEEFEKVQAKGGAIAAIEQGYYLSAIMEGANARQRSFDRGERVSVGVNRWEDRNQDPLRGIQDRPGP